MKKYLKSINELNNLTLSLSKKNPDEIQRYSESDIFWANNKCKPLQNRTIKKGSICQFEFGKNFVPEMSYEHRGLVIGSSGKLLYVLPICSFNPALEQHRNAYHPTDNPESKSNFFMLKKSEFSFLTHDSVLKLNDIRTVSIARIKYKQHDGFIATNSITYTSIERIVLSKYFHNFAYRYEQLIEENQNLKIEIQKLQEEIKELHTQK